MKRVILDTNIYGRIIEKEDVSVIETITEKTKITIYGFDVVRRELRNTPKDKHLGRKSYRLALLTLYDKIIKSRNFEKTGLIDQLAKTYMTTFEHLFDNVNQNLFNDFLIIACASIHDLDIVVSDDNRTMLSDYAKKTYTTVNSIKGYRTPKFINYEEFRRSILV